MSGVVGIGLDLVEVARIRGALTRHGERFLGRIAGPEEGRLSGPTGTGHAEHVAGLFAAKEAVLKALGTGAAEGLTFRDVIITKGPGGRPSVLLAGEARRRADALGVMRIHLSITHERGHAAAMAVLEGAATGEGAE